MRPHLVQARLTGDELALLDALVAARGTTRSGVLRALIRQAGGAAPEVSRQWALERLRDRAADGSVNATIALERALRVAAPAPPAKVGRLSPAELRAEFRAVR